MAPVTLLQTQSLSKHFGGVAAVDGVDFALPKDEIRGLIGPNGAGKTTLVSLVCGRVPPGSGRIEFEQRDITHLAPWNRTRLGIVYAFQVTSIYQQLSCYENVAIAAQQCLARNWHAKLGLRESAIAERVDRALNDVSLSNVPDKTAGELPYGHQRLLEVAMTLALEPSLLILDEPTQGLAQSEIDGLDQLIRSISKRVTILLIEHNMPFVLQLAHRITVMDQGRIIAEDTPQAISQNEEVQRVYLGA
ncbi:MAG: ABC transporter ATP-binding protein [Gammaproteobacteria bacterium]